jgi:hypothetical protein
VLWSKTSVSAWLECVVVKIVSFSMAGKCHSKKKSISAWLECAVI